MLLLAGSSRLILRASYDSLSLAKCELTHSEGLPVSAVELLHPQGRPAIRRHHHPFTVPAHKALARHAPPGAARRGNAPPSPARLTKPTPSDPKRISKVA